jgi:hypothetical protein
MGAEPLPNIRDGIFVERLVKTMRYVADMRRRQYVVQRPEGVRRRQRLSVEYVDRRAGDLLVLQHADQCLLFDDRHVRTRTADLYRVNFLGDLGTDEVERRQVAWGELISARFRDILLQAIRLSWRHLQGLT